MDGVQGRGADGTFSAHLPGSAMGGGLEVARRRMGVGVEGELPSGEKGLP